MTVLGSLFRYEVHRVKLMRRLSCGRALNSYSNPAQTSETHVHVSIM
jgi:hypothetical protein